MTNNNFVKTLDFGYVPIRRTHTDGEEMAYLDLSFGGCASIRKDPITNQPFAVICEENDL